jgi:hypothetical protein
LHQVFFPVVEWARLTENDRVEMDLADIMKDPGEGETIEVGVIEPEPGTEVDS